MIDVHNHLLPGIDDGAADMTAALAMARVAVAQGITHLVCTPHIQPRRYDNTKESIAAALDGFATALREAAIPLRVASAAEVRFGLEILQDVAQGRLPFLGDWRGKRVLLLEFPHNEVPFGAERLTAWLLARDVLPMIAHPERNRGLIANPEKLRPFVAQGCLLQITGSSLTGHFGPESRDLAIALLQQGLVSVIASDAHNEDFRPPALQAGFEVATQQVGERAARTLVEDNPWELVQAQFERS